MKLGNRKGEIYRDVPGSIYILSLAAATMRASAVHVQTSTGWWMCTHVQASTCLEDGSRRFVG